jgi:hypothetical protein
VLFTRGAVLIEKFKALTPIAATVIVLAARPAHADPSAWLSAAGGAGWLRGDAAPDSSWRPLLLLETGLGTPSTAAMVVGGVVKTLTFFGAGTDLALAARVASGSFARGDFGLAVDLGGYERLWQRQSSGFAGALVLGAPWGIQASFQAEIGTHQDRTYAATLGVDFLRLTVYRTTGLGWWDNPSSGVR